MDGTYGLHSTVADYSDKALMSPEDLILQSEYQSLLSSETLRLRIPILGSEELLSEAASIRTEEDMSALIKAKIASHPCYPRLLEAYIDCQKVGAPPGIACFLDEIRRENDLFKQGAVSTYWGADPELDEFMETYCDLLVKYKSDLERPLDEATTFLNKIEMQLRNLCTGASIRSLSGQSLSPSMEDPLIFVLYLCSLLCYCIISANYNLLIIINASQGQIHVFLLMVLVILKTPMSLAMLS
ncbi:hypothetical protein POTOM_037431 [Populus tomentosa]|uniref:Homeobox protein knotted-1-like 6 n=1 Tax=Populus tomentosa TaxID=118781 RepID=A0A8X8CK28_POPTO|nr:hypothetical protein POTOM_037431 [Populus tomentosa]